MDLEERLELVIRNTVEVVTLEDLNAIYHDA